MHAEAFVGTAKAGNEDDVGFVGGAKVAVEEVGENSARCVESCCVRVVLLVPFVFEAGEGLGGIFSAKSEMTLGVVRVTVWLCQPRSWKLSSMLGDSLPSAYSVPATWCNSGSPVS